MVSLRCFMSSALQKSSVRLPMDFLSECFCGVFVVAVVVTSFLFLYLSFLLLVDLSMYTRVNSHSTHR